MTVQSSFLIRCTLHAPGEPPAGKAFYIQHVQTGAEFRAATLDEVAEWTASQNLAYLTQVLNQSAAVAGTEEEL